MPRRLPDDIKREVNRLAHALAQWSFIEQRRRLEADARAMLTAGRPAAEVVEVLQTQTAARS